MPRSWHEGLGGAGKKVDDEHRLQLDLVDVAEHLARNGADLAIVQGALEQLARFSEAHFRAEELLQRLYGYAGGESHAEEHRALGAHLREIQDRAAGGAGQPLAETLAAWRSSLLRHIERSDGDFARSERALMYVRGL